MSSTQPIICFGQQPCGIFPKRFLIAKILTARRLQQELGGKIVWFYHDSDHDYRETITLVHDQEGREERLNFTQENKLQKKFSPLYLKRLVSGWQEEMGRRMHRFVDLDIEQLFKNIQTENAADFCLEMYRGMGLLEGIELIRSSDMTVRERAQELIEEYFADVAYEGEIVRAKFEQGKLRLHQGGDVYTDLPAQEISKKQKSPTRDTRLLWMQSVVHCSHYIYGGGEGEYLDFSQTPEITFVKRDEIEKAEESWITKL
jgi:hypothetical protein